ncbi:hypothetical protein L1049_004405 [Liquidambar formosana]|uniref:Uncharacterized protein n=1 Tax=Liquidambar formosana TaxID=63359 RepID=A0AAP0RN69_LIQFO
MKTGETRLQMLERNIPQDLRFAAVEDFIGDSLEQTFASIRQQSSEISENKETIMKARVDYRIDSDSSDNDDDDDGARSEENRRWWLRRIIRIGHWILTWGRQLEQHSILSGTRSRTSWGRWG